jgi:hypothetical protein
MSDADLGDALVIVHPLLAPVLDHNIAHVLAPAIWKAITGASPFVKPTLRLGGLPAAEWRQLIHDGEREDAPLRELFPAGSGPVIYFGMAPITVALELGKRLGPTHRVLAYYGGPQEPSDRP